MSSEREMSPNAVLTISPPLTSFVVASLAKTSALQGDGRDWMESDLVFGTSLLASLASLGPDGCWLKTCQGYCQRTMEGQWVKFSETWPRAGTMQAGTVYQRQPLVPLTAVTEYSSWPTPTVMDTFQRKPSTLKMAMKRPRQGNMPPKLADAVQMWPTPRVSMANGPSQKEVDAGNPKRRIETEIAITDGGGQLNPTWVELLMGFPMGWTDLDG